MAAPRSAAVKPKGTRYHLVVRSTAALQVLAAQLTADTYLRDCVRPKNARDGRYAARWEGVVARTSHLALASTWVRQLEAGTGTATWSAGDVYVDAAHEVATAFAVVGDVVRRRLRDASASRRHDVRTTLDAARIAAAKALRSVGPRRRDQAYNENLLLLVAVMEVEGLIDDAQRPTARELRAAVHAAGVLLGPPERAPEGDGTDALRTLITRKRARISEILAEQREISAGTPRC